MLAFGLSSWRRHALLTLYRRDAEDNGEAFFVLTDHPGRIRTHHAQDIKRVCFIVERDASRKQTPLCYPLRLCDPKEGPVDKPARRSLDLPARRLRQRVHHLD